MLQFVIVLVFAAVILLFVLKNKPTFEEDSSKDNTNTDVFGNQIKPEKTDNKKKKKVAKRPKKRPKDR